MAEKVEKKILDLSASLIHRDRDRDLKFEAMNIMFHNRSAKPPELENTKWFRWVPTTAPSDAVWGATRVLSAIEPALKYAPVASDSATVQNADRIERVLKSLYKQAGQRSKSKHTRQMVWNAILYDLVAIQMEFLPFVKKKATEKRKKRIERTERFGPFVINVRNAKSVHPVHSEFGLDAVLFEQVVKAKEAMAFWQNEDLNKEVANVVGDGRQNQGEWIYILDYTDDEKRWVWAYVLPHGTAAPRDFDFSDDFVTLINDEHELPFIPWIVKGGGSTTETDPEKHYRPMLDSIYHSGSFNSTNLMRSMLHSEVIYKYRKADSVTNTLSGQPPQFDENTGGPRTNVALRVGEQYQPIPPDQLDPALFTLSESLEQEMAASTISKILLGEVPGDIAFATLNLGQQSAARSIIPYQEVAQDALSEMFTQMLLWSIHSEENLVAFIPVDSANISAGRDLYTIDHRTVDPKSILIEVELKADVPSDRQNKINAMVAAMQAGLASRRFAMEQIGITDPTQIMEEIAREALNQVEVQNAASTLSKEFMEQMIQLAMQRLTEQAEAQQQQGQDQQGQPTDQSQNPAQGALSPEGGNPGVSDRVTQTGVDSQGNDVQ